MIISYTVSNACGSVYATYPITETGPAAPGQAGATSGNTTICVGGTTTLANSVNGGVWSSANNNIATIDPQTGIVTGVGAGIAAITYTLSSNAGTDQVFTPVIVNPAPDNISITAKPGTTIATGQKLSLTAEVKNGAPVHTYEWLLNNKTIAGATSAAFSSSSFANNDEVTCKVLGECGDQSVSGSVVIFVSDDDVAQIKAVARTDIRVVPNPNKGTFMIRGSLGTTADEEVSVEITDVLGQVVYTGKFTAHSGELNERVQLSSSTANGMYLLSIHAVTDNKVFHIVVEQ